MHEKFLRLTIATATETLFDGLAASVSLPGSSGIMTVLPHHEAIVTTLKTGEIAVLNDEGERKVFAVSHGVFEMSGNRAVVLL